MSRPPSTADRDLATRLRALGIDATAERVQAFREVGLLARPDTTYPGGGGSVGRYPTEAVDRMREAVALADKYPRALQYAVLVMFVRARFPIAEGKLRRAFLHVVKRQRSDMARAAGESAATGDPIDIVVSAGETLAKRVVRDPTTAPMRRRIKRQQDRRREDVVVDIMTSAADLFETGSVPSPQSLEHMADYLGLTELVGRDAAKEAISLVQPNTVAFMKHEQMDHALRVATLDDFVRARDDAIAFDRCVTALGRIAPSLFNQPLMDTSDVIGDEDGRLVFLTIANVSDLLRCPTEYEDRMRWPRQISALTHLLDVLPPELHAFYLHHADDPPNLTKEHARRHDEIRQQFSVDFPAESALLPYHSE